MLFFDWHRDVPLLQNGSAAERSACPRPSSLDDLLDGIDVEAPRKRARGSCSPIVFAIVGGTSAVAMHPTTADRIAALEAEFAKERARVAKLTEERDLLSRV